MDRGRGDVSDEEEAKDWKEALWDWDFFVIFALGLVWVFVS